MVDRKGWQPPNLWMILSDCRSWENHGKSPSTDSPAVSVPRRNMGTQHIAVHRWRSRYSYLMCYDLFAYRYDLFRWLCWNPTPSSFQVHLTDLTDALYPKDFLQCWHQCLRQSAAVGSGWRAGGGWWSVAVGLVGITISTAQKGRSCGGFCVYWSGCSGCSGCSCVSDMRTVH